MSYKTFPMSIAVFIMASFFVTNVSAVAVGDNHNFEFAFNGDCQDCAFIDPNNPLLDELFEEVTGTLSFTGVSLDINGVIGLIQGSTVEFSYNGSNLLNPFILAGSRVEVSGSSLSSTGQILSADSPFVLTSPFNPEGGFEDEVGFCTSTGEGVLGLEACLDFNRLSFSLAANGDFSISSFTEVFDVGSAGQLSTAVSTVPVPAAAWLFGSALLGFMGFSRRKLKM